MPLITKTYLRIPRDLYKIVVKMAEQDGRSINGEIVYLLKTAIERLGDPRPG
jgi:hypothetical protein